MSDEEEKMENAEDERVPEEREEEKEEVPELPDTPFIQHLKELGGKRELEVLDIIIGLPHQSELLKNLDPIFQSNDLEDRNIALISQEL